MKFLHTADLHLANESHLENLKLIIDTANLNHCDYIFIAGDLFDNERAGYDLEGKMIPILEAFLGQIFICSGNHDMEFLSKNEKLSKNSTVFANQMLYALKLREVTLYIAPYQNQKSLSTIIEENTFEPNSILMCHGTFYNNEYFYDKKDIYYPILLKDVENTFRYVAIGHFHTHFQVEKENTVIVNPGSPRITRISDIGKRVVSLVDTDSWNYQFIPLNTYFIHEIHILLEIFDDKKSLYQKVHQEVKADLHNPLCFFKIHLEGVFPIKEQSNAHEWKNFFENLLKEELQVPQDRFILHLDAHMINPKILNNNYINQIFDSIEESYPSEKQEIENFLLTRLQYLNK